MNLNSWVISVFIFLSAINVFSQETDSCQQYNEDSVCTCCKDGYMGHNCSEICSHCESVLLQDVCRRSCKNGRTGTKCEHECPEGCALTRTGVPRCTEDNGKIMCTECVHGFCGKSCEIPCPQNCLKNECSRTCTCEKCKGEHSYGDFCNKTCNGCFENVCSENGTCLKGCMDGYHGMTCDQRCTTSRCSKCERSTGKCLTCMDNTLPHCNEKICVCKIEGSTETEEKHGPDVAKRTAWFAVIPVVIVVIVIITGVKYYDHRKQHRRHNKTRNQCREDYDLECAQQTEDMLARSDVFVPLHFETGRRYSRRFSTVEPRDRQNYKDLYVPLKTRRFSK